MTTFGRIFLAIPAVVWGFWLTNRAPRLDPEKLRTAFNRREKA